MFPYFIHLSLIYNHTITRSATNIQNILSDIKRKAVGNVQHALTPTSLSFCLAFTPHRLRGYALFWVYLPAVLQAFTSRKQAADLAHILQ